MTGTGIGLPEVSRISLRAGQILHVTGIPIDAVYFPETAVLSIRIPISGDDLADVALVGHDGMAGVSAVMGRLESRADVVVQLPGTAYRMGIPALKAAMAQDATFERFLLWYLDLFLGQVMQNAACGRQHTLPARAARVLLELVDLTGSTLLVTHEFVAAQLGTTRSRASMLLEDLRDDGLIAIQRGTITVQNRGQLATRACGCYARLTRERAAFLRNALLSVDSTR